VTEGEIAELKAALERIMIYAAHCERKIERLTETFAQLAVCHMQGDAPCPCCRARSARN
jgi:hypothetical protein